MENEEVHSVVAFDFFGNAIVIQVATAEDAEKDGENRRGKGKCDF